MTNIVLGVLVSGLLIGIGYMIRTKQTFFFLAGFNELWHPVNEERLSKRVGLLVMLLGVLALITTIATPFVGDVAGNVSLVAAILLIVLIGGVLVLDRFGY